MIEPLFIRWRATILILSRKNNNLITSPLDNIFSSFHIIPLENSIPGWNQAHAGSVFEEKLFSNSETRRTTINSVPSIANETQSRHRKEKHFKRRHANFHALFHPAVIRFPAKVEHANNCTRVHPLISSILPRCGMKDSPKTTRLLCPRCADEPIPSTSRNWFLSFFSSPPLISIQRGEESQMFHFASPVSLFFFFFHCIRQMGSDPTSSFQTKRAFSSNVAKAKGVLRWIHNGTPWTSRV